MLKVSHFAAQSDAGYSAIPLFGKGDAEFEKCASGGLLPDVVQYIEALRPQAGSQYVLVNAMAAGEYFGSNINGDHFPEAGLIHKPEHWTGNPLLDKIPAKKWAYGFPTFYNAHPYAHHRNKDPKRAFGDVELAAWNDNMKRVELVTRVDHSKCQQFGGTGVWDRLTNGNYPDVSMGTKVPYDTCSICLDWDLYHKALASFDPKRHTHPGQAALQYHKNLKSKTGKGIRGLSVTRKDYCEHAKQSMNKILPDGRKVWVYNDYPRFFDISFVFIGADKTAKVMLFVSSNGKTHTVKPSAQVADEMKVPDPGDSAQEKTASIEDLVLKTAFGKLAKPKRAAIDKDIVPSQFAGKAVPVLTRSEKPMPTKLLDGMASVPLKNSLSTSASMGMVLSPSEFQRLVLTRMGKRDVADKLESRGCTFCKSDCSSPMELGADQSLPALAQLLLPMLAARSSFGPIIERRVVIMAMPRGEPKALKATKSDDLDKIAAAYNGYRTALLDVAAEAHSSLTTSLDGELSKLGSAEAEELFTPLSVSYLQGAFLDGFGVLSPEVVKLSGRHSAWRGVSP